MPNSMSKAQTNFYIWRLRLFWSQSQCAEEVECSLLSWRAWEAGDRLPSKMFQPAFEKALMSLARRLNRKVGKPGTQFYARVADALMLDDYPQFEKPDLPGVSLEYLNEQLIDRLYKKEVRSTRILREFMGLGYSRMQIYHAIKKLGVHKRHAVKGRGGYSLWTIRR